MSLLEQQVEKARSRARGLDLPKLARTDPGCPPAVMATPRALEDRRRLLARTRGEDTDLSFERLIEGNELQPVNYLARGMIAARPVCRLTLNAPAGGFLGYATGFLVAPGVLLTNNHVFPSSDHAARSVAEFDLELDARDQPRTPVAFALRPDRLFATSEELDYAIVAVEERGAGGVALADYGYLPLIDSTGKAVEGEWLTIIQHPGGERKQLCVRENKLLARTDDVLWYSTDTLGGSSGSPVFNNDWQVVALHHRGVPETKDGVWQTVDGHPFDPARDDETAIKWIANEGIRVSRLVGDLRQRMPDEPLLQPILTMTAERARALVDGFATNIPPTTPATAMEPSMPASSITLTLDIAEDGRVSVRGSGVAPAVESSSPVGVPSPAAPPPVAALAPAASTPRPPQYAVTFDQDYGPDGARQGYEADYLGAGFEVPVPELGPLEAEATRRIDKDPPDPHRLDYRGYSLVMHARRKFAIYTAANVDGAQRFSLRRPSDTWRYDPRIPREAQIGDYYYARNQFDRGHLTRYEDMEYGATPTDALRSAADTLHFTNCTPQHARFNQSKELWQGLEQAVLEQAIEASSFRAQVLTGPVLDPGDPVWDRYPDIQYPLRFWKIAAAIARDDQGRESLFAAGFVLDQADVVAQFGIEAAEVPFPPFKTYQVPIAEIKRLTGLAFPGPGGASLSDADPLADPRAHRAALARVATTVATGAGAAVPPGYVPLTDGADIVGLR